MATEGIPERCSTCETAIPSGRTRCPGCGRVFGEDNRCVHCHAIAPARRSPVGLVCLACGGARDERPNSVIVASTHSRHGRAHLRLIALALRLGGIALVAGGVLGAAVLSTWLDGIRAFILGALLGGASVAAGAALLRTAFRLRAEASDEVRAAREQAVLELARAGDGTVTVTEVARHFGETFEASEKFLVSLVDENRVALDIQDDGVLLYRFREVQSHGAVPRLRIGAELRAESEEVQVDVPQSKREAR
jgi:hypothetical protein